MNHVVSPALDQDDLLSRFTVNDINVGAVLYEVLVQHAHDCPGRSIYYSDLLSAARRAQPDNAEVERAVPIGIGPKLLFVQAFCDRHGYPNLACLAVNRATELPGSSFRGNWQQEMARVAAFDWSIAQPRLQAFATELRAAAMPRKRVKEAEAREVVYRYYVDNKASYPTYSSEQREEIVRFVMEGIAVHIAFQQVLGV